MSALCLTPKQIEHPATFQRWVINVVTSVRRDLRSNTSRMAVYSLLRLLNNSALIKYMAVKHASAYGLSQDESTAYMVNMITKLREWTQRAFE